MTSKEFKMYFVELNDNQWKLLYRRLLEEVIGQFENTEDNKPHGDVRN